jgi:uncharacterized membrane protein YbhN (UPF0104 family)
VLSVEKYPMKNNVSTPPSRQSRLINLLKIIFAIVLIGFVLSNTRFDQLKTILVNISMGWAVLSFFLYALLTLLKAFQYYILINEKVTYPQVLNVVVLQNAVSNFLATSAGIASYLTLFHVEHGVKVSRAAIVFLLTKTGDLIAIWVLLLVSSWLVWPQVEVLHVPVLLLLAGMGIVVATLIVAINLRQRFVEFAKRIVDRLGLSRFGIVRKGVDILQTLGDQEQASVIRKIKLVLITSSFYLAVGLMCIYSSLRVFNLKIGILPILFSNALLQVISYLPIQIFGGLGVNEFSNMFLYGLFNISAAVLSPVLIGSRVMFYLMNLLILLYLPIYSIFFKQKSPTM